MRVVTAETLSLENHLRAEHLIYHSLNSCYVQQSLKGRFTARGNYTLE